MREDLYNLVYDVIDALNAELPPGIRMPKEPAAAIAGRERVLDSLGVVTLITEIENAVRERYAREIPLADVESGGDLSHLDTVASLVNYLEQKLEK